MPGSSAPGSRIRLGPRPALRPPAGHRQRGPDAVCRDEAELPGRAVIAAAGDDHMAEPSKCGLAAVPVNEGQQWMDGASGAIGLERARVRGGGTFGFGERGVVRARGARRREECAVRLLCGVREVTLEVVEEDGGASLYQRKGVAPEP